MYKKIHTMTYKQHIYHVAYPLTSSILREFAWPVFCNTLSTHYLKTTWQSSRIRLILLLG